MTLPKHPLGQAIAEGLNAHADHLREDHAEFRKAERLDFIEHLEAEGVEAVTKMIGEKLDCSQLPPDIAKLVGQLCKPEHPAQGFSVGGILVAIGYVLGAAALAGPVSQIAIQSMRTSGRGLIDAPTLAMGALTGRVGDDWARDDAKDWGLSSGQFDALKLLATQNLPPSEAIEFWRRFPDQENLADNQLERSGLSAEAQAMAKAMRWRPMDLGVAVAAVTQNQIDMPMFERLLGQNGVNPEWAKIIYESAGATMPPEMAVRLFREKRIDQAKYEEILTESNLKNKYVPLMKWLQYRPPPMEQALRMRRRGLLEHDETVKILEQDGFENYYAEKLVQSAETQASGGARELTVSTIIDLYEVGRWDRGTAEARLIKSGYDPDEANELVELADERKKMAAQNRGASKIHTRYVTWRIDRPQAIVSLDAIGIPTAFRDDLLDVWDVERDAQTLHLTRVDIKKAVQTGSMTTDEGRARLLAMGYTIEDLPIIEKIDGWVKASSSKAKDLSRADQVKRYKLEQITRPELVAAMLALGYDADEAEQIARIADGA